MADLKDVLPQLSLLVILSLPALCVFAYGEESQEVRPIILVFAHELPNFRDVIVEELRKDTRITEEIVPVDSPELLRTLLRLPNTRAVVMAGGDIPMFTTIENSVIQFFEDGGGLVAFFDFGNTIMAGRIAESVFPLLANSTKLGKMKEGQMRHELVRCDVMEINQNTPQNIALFDHSINLAWSSATGSCVYHPPPEGEHWVLYEDSEYGAPVVIAYDSEGLSVIFANGDVSDSAGDKFRYFGNFFLNEDFLTLFRNSVVWVKNGETRTENLGEKLDAIEKEVEELQDYLQRVDREEKARKTRSLALRITLTLAGLVGMAICYLFLIRYSGEEV